MADKSAIEWTDATWNPVTGCTKVSPGCDNCYAERIVERFRGKGAFASVVRDWEKLSVPLRWRKPRRVFVNSMSDLFHDDVTEGFIAHVFAVMALAERHTFQVLTKRHGRMRSLLRSESFRAQVLRVGLTLAAEQGGINPVWAGRALDPDAGPLRNVWLGVSVENQQWADIRIPALIDTPATVRWISAEPLVGPIDLRRTDKDALVDGGLDWVVVGGESGRDARPMHPDWARGIRDACVAASVPFFFKQWGAWAPAMRGGWYSRTAEVPGAAGQPPAFMYAPRSKSLRELDGRTWDEYPEVPVVR